MLVSCILTIPTYIHSVQEGVKQKKKLTNGNIFVTKSKQLDYSVL